MAKMMREIVGENNAHDNVLPAMTAEDFGFMLQEVPGAYGWIGNGNDALSQGDLHSTSYDFNDKNLELGALFWEKLREKRKHPLVTSILVRSGCSALRVV